MQEHDIPPSMKRVEVTLETHQRAVMEVVVPLEADRDEMRQAALAQLDESGGAEWVTLDGEEEFVVLWPRVAAEDQYRELLAKLGMSGAPDA